MPQEDQIKKASELDPVARYVNFVFYNMGKKELPTTLRLTQSEPLPACGDEMWDLLTSVEFPDVVRHLKTLAGLEPEPQQKPVEGKIGIKIGNKPFTARMYFDDQAPDPYCRITSTERGS